MKKVLFITPSLRAGGAEKVISILANEFSRRGIQTTLMITKWNEIQCEILQEVRIIVNDTNDAGAFSQIKLIWRTLKEVDYDCVVSFITMQNLYTLIANTFIGRKIIVSERNDPRTTVKGKKTLDVLRSFLYMRAYRIVFQTADAASYFDKAIQRRGVLIGNPINGDIPERYIGEREKRIVTVARLEPQKNLPMLIDAFLEVHNKHDDYVLEIYGAGALEEELKRYARDRCIADAVYFAGKVNNVYERIRKAAMFVLPSNFEGISNAMLEAMAIGLPVVCTDCPVGGARTYISDGINGMLTKVGDKNGLVKAMNYILENPLKAEEMGKEAVKIRDRLSVSKIVDQWEECMR